MKYPGFDIFDDKEVPTGRVASLDEVLSEGLWHQGVHVIIHTPHKEIVMQKRASTLKFFPNDIEISVGGGIDTGEMPIDAAIREVKEELGIVLPTSSLRFVGKQKYNHRVKNGFNRSFIYSYAACLPKHKIKFTLDAAETSSAFLITESKLRAALRLHRIGKLGRITPQYAYWKWLLDSI